MQAVISILWCAVFFLLICDVLTLAVFAGCWEWGGKKKLPLFSSRWLGIAVPNYMLSHVRDAAEFRLAHPAGAGPPLLAAQPSSLWSNCR